MDIVVICNGLGNQMSQYAYYLNKKRINRSTRFIFDRRSMNTHNGYELDKVFNISYREDFTSSVLFLIFRFLSIDRLPRLSKPIFKILKFIGISLIKEDPNYDFNPKNLKPSRGLVFYYGGWHSEKNFIEVKDHVIELFKFKQVDSDVKLMETLNEITSVNSVSIHVRRGDFLTATNMNLYGAVCTKAYFESAINKIYCLVDDPHFFIFSNDVQWVRENLVYENLTIVDFNKGKDSWKDMFLMSNCKHNINANSTFSWWGAWLNVNNNKIVVVPKYYINNLVTKDFYPSDWLKISDY